MSNELGAGGAQQAFKPAVSVTTDNDKLGIVLTSGCHDAVRCLAFGRQPGRLCRNLSALESRHDWSRPLVGSLPQRRHHRRIAHGGTLPGLPRLLAGESFRGSVSSSELMARGQGDV